MTNPSNKVTIIKQDPSGIETWRYSGEVIHHGKDHIIVEAFFDREDMLFHGMWLRKGDRFVETYYTKRWYNIFEIFDVKDNRHKGWYCNIATPAKINDNTISYRDLALDLLVFPDRRQLVLDKEEFDALNLPEEMAVKAQVALLELQEFFQLPPS